MATPSAPSDSAPRWIISRREDLTWFIGSSLAGYASLALMALGFPVLPLQFIWFFSIDGPHVMATITRTYMDRAERKKLGPFLWIVLPLLLIGPAASLAGYGSWFLLIAVCWQHFHITKQHFGFVMLYKAKNRERDPVDLKLDRWFLLSSLFVPLAVFLTRTRPAFGGLPYVSPALAIAMSLYGALAATWIGRQFFKLHRKQAMNWPKLALIGSVVPLQWLALLYASQFGPDGILRAGICLGLFHGLQYYRLLWFHNRNRYRGKEARERHGLAAHFVSSAAQLVALAIGLNLLLTFLPQATFHSEAVSCAVWGFPFTHYLLDARIWRVRGDRELASALHLP